MAAFARHSLRVALLMLGAAVLVVSPEPQPVAAEVPAAPKAATSSEGAYDHTAIGAVLKANQNKVPSSGKELMAALQKLGGVTSMPVVFSGVALNSGLTNPRVIIAPASRDGAAANPFTPRGVVTPPGFPAFPMQGFPNVPKPPEARTAVLSPAGVTDPSSLEGRLFFAVNMERETSRSDPRVKTIEFISWNSRIKRFDFGVIECDGKAAEMKILDGVRCFSCHKNKGPILGQGPWSNTTHNDNVRLAALHAFNPEKYPLPEPAPKGKAPKPPTPALVPGPFGGFGAAEPEVPAVAPVTAEIKEQTTFDGIPLVAGDPEVCDASIRRGGDFARDREIYRALTKTADGRRVFTILLATIAGPQPLDTTPQPVKQAIDLAFNEGSVNFAYDFVAINKSMSSTLLDYSPSGSMGSLRSVVTNQPTSWGSGSSQKTDVVIVWGGDPKSISEYSSRRESGESNVPSNHQPSNPKAFARPPVPVPPKPSSAVNPLTLAKLIGVTEGDRAFMAEHLDDLTRQVNRPKTTAAMLAREVFTTKGFTELLKSNDIPDREQLKDLFAAGLAEVAVKYKLSEGIKPARATYASGPNIAGGIQKEVAVVPTTVCMGCHDVLGDGKKGFNPIPKLAFDPFDKSTREVWAKQTDAKKKQAVLGRMLKRMATDRDMPPEDSAEYQRFREKDQPAFDAIRDWLEAELAKAKG